MTSPPHSFLAERWIARILRGGIMLSVFFMVTGLFLVTIQSGSIVTQAENPSLADLMTRILNASAPGEMAPALMIVGLLLLMFTPFLRVVATVLVFLFEREWKYVAAALLVLLMLIGELIFAFR